ncbi:hypothetical protein [Microvirga alba]|uniref:Uncharacterized protein n=1 Tax=Microvirga alba TaxID=2791025 RepID=A0A931BLE6_9HYPH|nr:hypothetical protein [Microvirga alba]MBF9233401.1 hypothetical protein [Microvirga alba]
MKKVAVIMALVGSVIGAQIAGALITSALALQGPLTTALPCRQAQQIVAGRGAAVLNTGPYTYDRYVRDRSFCQIDEYLDPAWLPTRDTPQCFVGYRCKTGPSDLFGF